MFEVYNKTQCITILYYEINLPLLYIYLFHRYFVLACRQVAWWLVREINNHRNWRIDLDEVM
jgi:hypothetical protein